jgi:hypothetical protein
MPLLAVDSIACQPELKLIVFSVAAGGCKLRRGTQEAVADENEQGRSASERLVVGIIHVPTDVFIGGRWVPLPMQIKCCLKSIPRRAMTTAAAWC